jgi:hypothetical protein
MESMLRHLMGLLALFYGNSALAGSVSAATTGKVDSIETSVCRLIESSARTQSLPVAFLTRLIWQESSGEGEIIDAFFAAQRRKNPLLFPKGHAQICRLNV